jgi:hypothetical protein
MNGLLALVVLAMAIAVVLVTPDYTFGASAVLVCGAAATIAGFIISRIETDKQFLMRVFVCALLFRVFVGTMIYIFQLQSFFGGDAVVYDFFGHSLLKVWEGEKFYQAYVNTFTTAEGTGGGWGMLYLVAVIYRVAGRNMLATQLFNAVLGAATAPIIYLCAKHIFDNQRVARIALLFVAFYPSLALWSSQGLKDGPIVFLLALSMLCTLKLGERFNIKYLAILIFSMFGLLSLRFYVFYMVVAAVAGAFVIGMRAVTTQSFMRQLLIIVFMGAAFLYMGVSRYATNHMESFGNLERLQRSRLDMAKTGESGFAEQADISTTEGALSAIPVGMVYLLFAPFPWQLASLRQSITLPEMIVWWASFPLLVLGLWYTIKYRLRQTSPILIFTFMLTLAYSVFQGNVGTAYRQRSQLLVFYFIFVAVGYVLMQERREEKREQAMAARQEETRKKKQPPQGRWR